MEYSNRRYIIFSGQVCIVWIEPRLLLDVPGSDMGDSQHINDRDKFVFLNGSIDRITRNSIGNKLSFASDWILPLTRFQVRILSISRIPPTRLSNDFVSNFFLFHLKIDRERHDIRQEYKQTEYQVVHTHRHTRTARRGKINSIQCELDIAISMSSSNDCFVPSTHAHTHTQCSPAR